MHLPRTRANQKIVVNSCENKQFTFGQSVKIVDSQQLDRNSTNIRKGRDFGSIETKVRPPFIDSGIEQRCQPLGFWVDRRNIAALTKITDHARPSEIPKFGRTAMLVCNDVVDLVNGQRELFGNQAILATSKRPLMHLGPYALGYSHDAASPATRAFINRTTCSRVAKVSNSLRCSGVSLPSRFNWSNSFSLACLDEGSRNASIWLASLPSTRKSTRSSYSVFSLTNRFSQRPSLPDLATTVIVDFRL